MYVPQLDSTNAAAVTASIDQMIRGNSRLYPVVGYPVAQVRAPMLYNKLFAKTGLRAVVVPVEISPPDYPTVIRALLRAKNVPGALVTIPHKAASVSLLDDCSTAVRVAGACNAIVRRPDGSLYGDLFDGIGFVHAVGRLGFVARGARCLIIGAGGAGAAIAAALASAGAAAIRLHDTRYAHAVEVARRLQVHFPMTEFDAADRDPMGFALVVNATPLGMARSDPLPLDPDRLQPSMMVADIVMKYDMTPLLQRAQLRGCRIVLGREMLIEQIPLYLDFFGLPPATSDELRELNEQAG